MNEWDEAYKRLNKIDPQLDSAYEDDLVHAIYGAIWMVVAIGLLTGAIYGAIWMVVAIGLLTGAIFFGVQCLGIL